MADNLGILDGSAAPKTVRTRDDAGVHTPYHTLDSQAAGLIGAAVNTLPALTDRSGTVTTGATAQTVMAANSARRWGSFVNLDSLPGWIAEGATAAVDTAGSIEIRGGESYLVEGIGAVSWLHPTTGAKFTAKEG